MVITQPYKKLYKNNVGRICRRCEDIYIKEGNMKYYQHMYTDGGLFWWLYDSIESKKIDVIQIHNGPGPYIHVTINTQTNLAEWEE